MEFDEGYAFGIGAFETIAVYNGRPVFLEAHLERIKKTLNFLGIDKTIEVEFLTEKAKELYGEAVLKLLVSEKNILCQTRENPYKQGAYEKGFSLEISTMCRNDTSSFVFHKTFNYGENLFEKRKALKNGLDDYLFLNTKGKLTETSAANLFLVRDGLVMTPGTGCGLLPGIVRNYLLERYTVLETEIAAEEISTCEECFVTNSLMGVMPVKRIGKTEFHSRAVAGAWRADYLEQIRIL